jgi:hypothetical protein
MKEIFDRKILNNDFLLFKKVLNIGFFTFLKIRQLLGISLNKNKLFNNKINFYIYSLNYYKNYLEVLNYLIIDKNFYKKRYFFYKNLLSSISLTKVKRLRIGLPINGQRTRTNSKTSRKRFYNLYLKKIFF